jgi:L-threonylcarbamoyladenylate synthase
MSSIGHDIKQATEILRNGGLVAIPTETVYGLAANAYDPDAVARIFEVKKRPHFDPLIVHTHGLDEARSFLRKIPHKAENLASKFWPGPLTLLLPKKDIIPDLVTAGMARVAVRVPSHKMTDDLLQSIDFPVVAPSANPFGYVSPTTADHVYKQLGTEIDYILDGGECHVGIESTIVGFDEDQPMIYRLGGLEKEQVEEIVGPVKILPHSSSNPQAPGMLKSHYSPSKKLVMGEIESLINVHSDKNIGILRFQPVAGLNGYKNQIILSKDGDLREAAKNLFSALRKLDDMDIELIIAEKAPNHGLGLAINDRLKRASV